MSEQERILQNMRDAGCGEQDIREVDRFLQCGSDEAVMHCLKRCRCILMEELHQSHRRVDCLDHLIRKRESEMVGKR